MTRSCSVCRHAQHQEIDALLLAGSTSMRAIAGQFLIGRSAMQNHAKNHLRQRIAMAQAAPGRDPGADALANLHAATVATDIAACATLRDHVLADLARIERVIEAGLAVGSTTAVMSAIRVKYLLLARAGLVKEPDKLLAPGEAEENVDEARAKRLQSAMEKFLSGQWGELEDAEENTSKPEVELLE